MRGCAGSTQNVQRLTAVCFFWLYGKEPKNPRLKTMVYDPYKYLKTSQNYAIHGYSWGERPNENPRVTVVSPRLLPSTDVSIKVDLKLLGLPRGVKLGYTLYVHMYELKDKSSYKDLYVYIYIYIVYIYIYILCIYIYIHKDLCMMIYLLIHTYVHTMYIPTSPPLAIQAA